MQVEIQGVHFGASNKVLSLETGGFYQRVDVSSEVLCISFGTVSECLNHDAAALWVHNKILKNAVPNLITIRVHFQSDGSSTLHKRFFLYFNIVT